MVGELDERGGGNDLHLGAGPGGFRAASAGTDETLGPRIGPDRCGQHARDRGNGAIEAKLAQHGKARECIRGNGADRSHQPERNRQVVVAAFLGKVGGGKVDRDPPRRKCQSRGDEPRTDPFARLGDGLVGEAHHIERGKPRRDLDLDIDGARLDALERHGCDPLHHASPCLAGRC